MSNEFVSAAWIDSLCKYMSDDSEFAEASRTWLYGPLALVVEAAPDLHFPETVAIRLDVHEGTVREARAIALDDLRLVPSQVWTGFARWKQLINSKGDLVAAALQSKARVVGDVTVIVNHRDLMAAIMRAAAAVKTDWQDDMAAARETAGATA